MTLFKESVTLNYLLTAAVTNLKEAAKLINTEPELKEWVRVWGQVRALKEAMYAVASQVDKEHYQGKRVAFTRIYNMNDIFYLSGEDYNEATLQLLDLMLEPDRINETVMYIIHGDM